MTQPIDPKSRQSRVDSRSPIGVEDKLRENDIMSLLG
jgi:hypothetical protein